jgi:DNA-binding CsgD family transcriptional regulator
MALASQGLDSGQIAQRLGLSVHTVKVHLRLAYRRLRVHNRVSAVNLLHAVRCPQCGCDLRAQGQVV